MRATIGRSIIANGVISKAGLELTSGYVVENNPIFVYEHYPNSVGTIICYSGQVVQRTHICTNPTIDSD